MLKTLDTSNIRAVHLQSHALHRCETLDPSCEEAIKLAYAKSMVLLSARLCLHGGDPEVFLHQ